MMSQNESSAGIRELQSWQRPKQQLFKEFAVTSLNVIQPRAAGLESNLGYKAGQV